MENYFVQNYSGQNFLKGTKANSEKSVEVESECSQSNFYRPFAGFIPTKLWKILNIRYYIDNGCLLEEKGYVILH